MEASCSIRSWFIYCLYNIQSFFS